MDFPLKEGHLDPPWKGSYQSEGAFIFKPTDANATNAKNGSRERIDILRKELLPKCLHCCTASLAHLPTSKRLRLVLPAKALQLLGTFGSTSQEKKYFNLISMMPLLVYQEASDSPKAAPIQKPLSLKPLLFQV